jgi:hypothetical protein
MDEASICDASGETLTFSLDHAGQEVFVSYCGEDNMESRFLYNTYIPEGDCLCFLTPRNVSIHDEQPLVVVAMSWKSLADTVLRRLETYQACSLCGNFQTNSCGICDGCLFSENKMKCVYCKRSFGMFSREPGAGNYHPECKRRRLQ